MYVTGLREKLVNIEEREHDQPMAQPTLLSTLEQLLALDATEVRPTLQRTADQVGGVLKAEKVDMLLYEAETDSLVAYGVSDTPLSRLEQARGLDRMPLANRGRAVDVFQTMKPHFDGRVDQDERELVGVRVELGVRSSMMVPLLVDSQRRGAVTIASTKLNQFTDDDFAFLRAVTHWIGHVLHRAELVEQRTREATLAARRAVAEELMTVFAHDFRTPLTPLLGYLYILHERAVQNHRADDVRALDASLRNAQRLQTMTEDMLDASRIDQGIFAVQPQMVELRALLAPIVELLGGAEEHVDFQSSEETMIEGDPVRLQQVFENLISNALRFSPPNVPVRVGLSRMEQDDAGWARITVRDSGPGIPPDLQAVLFDRYALNHRVYGLGLGLYLARGIVQAHGGSLHVESTPGDGATFTVLLPNV